MRQLAIPVLAGACLVLMSCVELTNQGHDRATTLEQDLQSAKPVMYGNDREQTELIRKKLYRWLSAVGDEEFAMTLERQPNEVQTEVCNVMGLLEDKRFDKYPKTRHALGAAPKI